MIASPDESSEIIQRMQELRSAGKASVHQLHVEAERVTDWREHVRARPMLATAAAAFLGYTVVKAMTTPASSTLQANSGGHSSEHVTRPGPTLLISLVGGIATSFAKQWVNEYLRKQLRGTSDVTESPHGLLHADQNSRSKSEPKGI